MGTAYDDVTGAGASPTVWQPLPRQLGFSVPKEPRVPYDPATAVLVVGSGHSDDAFIEILRVHRRITYQRIATWV
jgi:hypothetical protein